MIYIIILCTLAICFIIYTCAACIQIDIKNHIGHVSQIALNTQQILWILRKCQTEHTGKQNEQK